MNRPAATAADGADGADTAPWPRITVDTPGTEFEPRPPGQYAYDFPDTECDGWSTPDFTVRSASVRGESHRYYEKPRQDAARVAVHEDSGAIVFAVADGVSSATDAQFGAVEACRAAMERMLLLLSSAGRVRTDRDAPLDFDSVIRNAAVRLRELAQWRLASPERQPVAVTADWYATTLVAGVVQPGPAGPEVHVCRVGDSGAWVMDRARRAYQPLFRTKTGADTDVVSNAVVPLPHVPERPERADVRLSPDSVLLVGTDGFGDPLGDGDGQVGALFARHLAVPPAPLRLAHVLDFSRETFDDDRTLVAVWPKASGGVR